MTKPTNLILGTAGHIDHGKSSLILALTGKDPDRLKEEKARGITIELGFAQLELPSGRTMGVVDVPGHEKFVRQMVSGATGTDVALLVIAADDGIMPQTVEHMAVLELLGVSNCVVALTKSDMVGDDWAELMAEEVAQELEGTPFRNAPVIPCSSKTGKGLDSLLAALDEAASRAERTKPAGAMRMPVDRVFTVKGFGTVATGTLWSGSVAVGDEAEVLPSGQRTRIRSVQMHDQDCSKASAGNRVAVCLSDLSTDDIRPGMFLSAPGRLQATDRFDTRLRYSDPFGSGKPLETGSRVHVAHGTREVIGRVLLMDGVTVLEPGGEALAQIRLEEPLPVSLGDRYIIRSYSPVRVIGGGSILLPHPRRRTNLKQGERDLLAALEQGDVQSAVDASIGALTAPCALEQLAKDCGLEAATIAPAVEAACKAKKLSTLDGEGKIFSTPSISAKACSAIEKQLIGFHSAQPDQLGMSRSALKDAVFPNVSPEAFNALLDLAAAKGQAVQAEGIVSHPRMGAGAKVAVTAAEAQLEKALLEAGAAPPSLNDLLACAGNPNVAKKALNSLVEQGRAVRVAPELFFSVPAVEAFRTAVRSHLEKAGSASAAELKDAMGTSRKYAIPLLEFFDTEKLTKRNGDQRTL